MKGTSFVTLRMIKVLSYAAFRLMGIKITLL